VIRKYDAVGEQVIELIAELEPGAAIPPERELCVRFEVSRMTLRRAIEELVREGYLDRQHGRGTFVSQPKIAQPLTMTSFSEDMRRRGYVPGSRTLSMRRRSAGAQLGRRLEISPSAEVLVAERVRLADEQPMAIETLNVPAAFVPGLTADDLVDASLYELLESRYGIVISSGRQTIEPTVTDETESELLDVPLHTPAFLFERTSRQADGVAVEFVRSVYRGDRYQLVAELHPSRSRTPRTKRTTASGPQDNGSDGTRPGSQDHDEGVKA
jgi:GntR family transcriptional regulator